MGRAIAYLTRRECFSACHRLHSEALTDEENRAIYSKCNNPNGHGHNYVVEVTVKGPVEVATGMVMNIQELKENMDAAIMQTMDHKSIDKDVPYFAHLVSTTENVSIFVWEQLKQVMAKPELLYEVKIWETEKNIVLYRGESE
jgi:6-pyruvoyltetrahydropterin/6-carboxytetrahydropterin synthase